MWSQSSQLWTPHNTPVSHCQTFCKGQATDGSVVGGTPGCRHGQWVHIHGPQLAQRAAPQDCTHHGAAAQPPRQLILLSRQEAPAVHRYFPFPQGESSHFFYIRGWNYPWVSLALHIVVVFLYHKGTTHWSGCLHICWQRLATAVEPTRLSSGTDTSGRLDFETLCCKKPKSMFDVQNLNHTSDVIYSMLYAYNQSRSLTKWTQ